MADPLSISGSLGRRPYFDLRQIENTCDDELQKVDLFPTTPQGIRIDRFIEKRFKIFPKYENLPAAVLGFTTFGAAGVETMTISRALSEENSVVAQRRVNSTLAHEAGHGLLHSYLFGQGTTASLALFENHSDVSQVRILCRQDSSGARKYDGRWWEFQANQAMGSLLLPRRLVMQCLENFLTQQGSFGLQVLEQKNRLGAVREVSSVFDVNPIVAEIRLNALFPSGNEMQLTL